MRRHHGRLGTPAAVIAALAMVVLGPTGAHADENPVEDTLTSVVEEAQKTVGGVVDATAPAATPERSATAQVPAPSSDDDSAGHETEDPAEPDHGQGTVADAGLAGQDVATIGDSTATIQDDDSTKADSTLLALGGEEILGAHADSEGEQEAHFGDPLAPLCEGSDGQVCLRLLYADAWATDDGTSSESKTQSGVAAVCLGGSGADVAADCEAPVEAGVATSEAEADRDQASGRTSASSESDLAELCIEEDEAGACALGASALHSEGESDSGGAKASADRESYLLALDAGNEEQFRVGDPQALALPPECPVGSSLLCLFLNQGETYVGDGVAGHAQEALHLDGLPGNLDLVVELGRTETLVHNDGGEDVAPNDDQRPEVKGVSGGPGRPGAAVGPAAGVLPNTGGVWTGLLGLALLGIGGGALLAARSRRGMGSLT